MRRAVLAAAVALGLAAQSALASPQVECPVCEVGVKGDSQRCEITPSATAVCLGCAPIANVSTINCNARVQGGWTSTFSQPACSTLLSDNNHCGACGNKCTGLTPTCANGKCNCTLSSCEGTSFCAKATTGLCSSCPAGTARCSSFGTIGAESDCSVNLNENTLHCGKCGNTCGSNELCVAGVCKCGSNAGCGSSGKVCVGDTDPTKSCLACSSPTNDQCPETKFCTLANECSACPEGMADCSNGGDTGSNTDCEANLLLSGDTPNCGACGVDGIVHSAMTCCKGKVKCGRFANLTSPSEEDCNAAAVCGFDEYCDEGLQMCAKLPQLPGYPRGNCDGMASTITGGNYLTSAAYCTSCNQTISQAALVNGSCLAYDHENCGAIGKNCSVLETCEKGKCICNWQVMGSWINYNAFYKVDPDKNIEYFAAPGCTYNDRKIQLLNGWSRKITTAVGGFLRCADLVVQDPHTKAETKQMLRSFNLANFSQPEVVATACPGGAGFCNATFCNTLASNITAFKPDFCEAIVQVAPYYAYCGKYFESPDHPNGDPKCASEDVIKGISNYALYSYFSGSGGVVQNAAFLGCPGLEAISKVTRMSTQDATISTGVEAANVMSKLGGRYFVGAENSAQGLSSHAVAVGVLAAVVAGLVM